MSDAETLPYPDGPTRPISPMAELDAFLSPRYRMVRQIGRGAMGTVVLATDTTLDRPVAIKLSQPGVNIDRQEREARTLAQVASPYVVSVYDFQRLNEHDGCVIMQYVEGEDLDVLRTRPGAVECHRVQTWMSQVAAGMSATEKARIVHRDLKPANILIDAEGDAHVTDFGLAYSPQFAQLTMAGDLLGTPLYIAPEQIDDIRSVDTRTDIYSFGATFYHVITGEPPFRSESVWDLLLKHKIEPLEPPISRNPRVPQHLNDCIERCLAKRPIDRFQSFSEVRESLQAGSEVDAWRRIDAAAAPHQQHYQAIRTSLLDFTAFEGGSSVDFPLNRRQRLTIVCRDLANEDTEAIVSSDDGHLSMGGGVSWAIGQAAGNEFIQEARRYTPVRQGRVVVTSARNLRARYVFHGITIGVADGRIIRPTRDIVAEIVDACIYQAETLCVRSIAFPLLGSGSGGLARDIALDTIFDVLLHRLLHQPSGLEEVRIVLHRNSS